MKNMKLGTKLVFGFSAVAVITLLIGIIGYYGAVKSGEAIYEIGNVRLPSVDSLLIIKENAENIRGTMRTLIIPGLSAEAHMRQYDNLAKAREEYEKAWKIYEPLPQSPEENEVWKQFVPAWDAWRAENNKLTELIKQFDRNGIAHPVELARRLEQFTKDHYILVHRIRGLLDDGNASFQGGEDHMACNAGKFLPAFKTENQALASLIKSFAEPHRRFHEAVGKIKRLVAEGKQDEALACFRSDMVPSMQDVFKCFDGLLAVANESATLAENAAELAMGPVREKQNAAMVLLDKLVLINRDVAVATAKTSDAEAAFVKMILLVAASIGVLLALTLGILITRNITKPIKRIIEGLDDGAEQVATASAQVSSASQSLAEGASEQAASIEETSSSLEEISSMTKQNADNANEADTLMKGANEIVSRADESMEELTASMGEISKASEETSKIIKTIDEIAFQTNLLALNAAVEAARAGEAGAGFAVVADEVRNLAMRAADAAKNTANLIEGTVKKVKDGSELVTRTNEAFGEVAKSAAKVGELVAEIAAASYEQAQGVDQVNTAVAEMDKVVQQNAANAEESASASEEMTAQAEQMKEMVDELVALVGGAGKTVSRGRPAVGRKAYAVPQNILRELRSAPTGNGKKGVAAKAIPAHAKGTNSKELVPHKAHILIHHGRKAKPEDVIPLKDEEFKDF